MTKPKSVLSVGFLRLLRDVLRLPREQQVTLLDALGRDSSSQRWVEATLDLLAVHNIVGDDARTALHTFGTRLTTADLQAVYGSDAARVAALFRSALANRTAEADA